MTYNIIQGDCVEQMAAMDEASVDAIVCDPPYELGFMGKAWDAEGVAYRIETWTEALRVLKPGGHLLAFGGTRTYHRLACAVEDAGFEIRDSLIWIYGSGFPKSLDVSKAIDKAAGAERKTVGRKPVGWGGLHNNSNLNDDGWEKIGTEYPEGQPITAPATPEAAQWQGWGTALKPSHEPVVVARKPLIGTVAANVLEYGTGALNVDGCRIEGQPRPTGTVNLHAGSGVNGIYGSDPRRDRQQTYDANLPAGRWPANVALDPEAAAELDAQSGESVSRIGNPRGTEKKGLFANSDWNKVGTEHNDSGGASRFFYCAKASRAERNAGATNGHPTVKPISLMRWLVRLVTPPGGTVLDPFTGSGTTGCAAVLEGFDFIGIEREAEYVEIAKARLAHWYAEPVALDLFGEAA